MSAGVTAALSTEEATIVATIGIIGGTGLENARPMERQALTVARTAFGDVMLSEGSTGGVDVVFVSRHGASHETLAHHVNHRANIAALRDRGVEQVVAANAVGSLRQSLPPGQLVVLSDFIDMTRRRHEPLDPHNVGHLDFSAPYCPRLRAALMRASETLCLDVERAAVYLSVDGPRFETPAEVRAFALLGADVVGMTGLPEAVLAREAGLCYAAVAIVTNLAAGLSHGIVAHERVAVTAERSAPAIWDLAVSAAAIADRAACCRHSP
ncbi:MAG TPA: MTAP family purine nucleoside phosphorylase [Chthonomonadales bacterium]|nr:MTAP family purine nucleoside phosphorylase [Chthonomonadales bacterium]